VITTNWIGIPSDPDCLFQRANGDIYFFKGTQYWKVADKYIVESSQDTVSAGYPKLIADRWVQGSGASRIPDSPDACFQRRSSGEIYFFKGTQYWKVADKYLDPAQDNTAPDRVVAGYPQNIVDKWQQGSASEPLPNKIDDIFQRSNMMIYFFAGEKYWRFPDKVFYNVANDVSDSSYPKIISNGFRGLVANADAVEMRARSNKAIYQFVGDTYFKYQDDELPCPCPIDIGTSTVNTCPTSGANYVVNFVNNACGGSCGN
jgi:hypothetical protein